MGDVVPFRDKRKWTRPEDYGHHPDEPRGSGGAPRPTPPPPRRKRARLGGFGALGFWGLVVSGLSLWVASDPVLLEPPAWLATAPERVNARFTICGQQAARHCVIDGDTFRIGQRTIRVIGIDAPETHPARCPAEAKLGAEATAQLQGLLNAGAFTMVARIDEPTDRYGRELRALSRPAARGEASTAAQSIAAAMIASGKARRYAGDFRKGWC